MNATSTRLLKETRVMFWPWCAVMAVAAFGPLMVALGFDSNWTALSGLAALGIPALAALSLGSEFQHRTLSVMLAQPVDRRRIWCEKLIVMLVAVASVGLLYYLVFHPSLEGSIWGAAFFVGIIGSAWFWVLFARSTVAAVVLSFAVQSVIFSFLGGLTATLPAHATAIRRAGVAGMIFYAGVMLWLGRRKFVRFQETGDSASNDLLAAFPKVVPEFVTRPFQLKQRGATLNLIEKEIRLLRPVFLLASMSLGLCMCIVPLRFLFPHGSEDFMVWLCAVGVGGYMVLGTMLAGCVSMGEERQLGTHSFHLTLPVSVHRLWVIKLATGILVSGVCGFLVTGVAGFLLGPAFDQIAGGFPGGVLLSPLACILIFTFPAFWCACAVNGTMRAVISIVPTVLVGLSAYGIGRAFVYGSAIASRVVYKAVLSAHPFPFPIAPVRFYRPLWQVAAMAAATIAIVQSHRLFRREQAGGTGSIFWNLIPLCIVLSLFGLSIAAPNVYISEILRQRDIVFQEVYRATDKLQFDPAKLESAHPQPITSADLNRVHPLSEITRAWLGRAAVNVSPGPKARLPGFVRNGTWQELEAGYAVNLHFPNNYDCTLYGTFVRCQPSGSLEAGAWVPLFSSPSH
jgi:ABC-type transport system involved in multi-copper enzyme maturation permease subunit